MGKVVDVQPGGIMVSGIYDEPGLVEAGADANVAPWDFFVEGFPHTVADDEDLQRDTHFTAFEMGTYTYTTVLGGSRTVRRLIYGKRCAIPADLIEAQQRALADRKEKLAREKADAAANALAWNQKQAEAGDAYGLLRMGERYLHGDGVETNADRARDYLARAAALGNARAKEELAAAGR
jgi:TPR repeat protein